jgi:hypothetical protein
MPTGIVAIFPPQTGNFWGLGSYRGSIYFLRYATYDSQTIPTGWNSGDISAAFSGSYIYDQAVWQKWGFSCDWQESSSTIPDPSTSPGTAALRIVPAA